MGGPDLVWNLLSCVGAERLLWLKGPMGAEQGRHPFWWGNSLSVQDIGLCFPLPSLTLAVLVQKWILLVPKEGLLACTMNLHPAAVTKDFIRLHKCSISHLPFQVAQTQEQLLCMSNVYILIPYGLPWFLLCNFSQRDKPDAFAYKCYKTACLIYCK